MLGYVLGMAASSLLIEWAHKSDRESLSEVLRMCSLLFEVAFLFGLVRLLFCGLRSGGRFLMRRWRATDSQASPGSPSH
ncbi:hypothetical protein CA984_19880 [Streptosporangium minutum]|uniref:Uncharacterized protein n=1 Tax=Streptosporangium minutum TaxID=569862 RepID=A0A243RJT6_9ACTN|nr:hypothetical protein CA984_19880 [Streptosporangium minutum]